jgi:threonyl-tRNA synthetase
MSLSLDEIYSDEYYILDTNGELYYPEEYEFKDEYFKSLVEQEVFKKEVKRGVAPHIRIMKKLKIAEYEPYTDSGHLTYLPKGALIMDLLAQRSLQVAMDYGAMPVKSSILYDLEIPAIKEHAGLFGQRMYKVTPEKRSFVLRYAACFGQFSLLKRHHLSYKDLPLKIVEIADSYRYEQRGEVTGLARLRRFFMPDMHVLIKDLEEAKDEFFKLYKLIFDEAQKYGWTYYSLYNLDPDFLRSQWNYIISLVRFEDKPVLIHTVKPNKYYWRINIEFNYIDSQMKPLETATIQIDVGNSRRFDITYVDRDGNRNYPVIIHTAIHGSLERFLYEFLEEAHKLSLKGKKPMLPIWLSPTQIRLIPVTKEHIDRSVETAKRINSYGLRCDVDDRELTVSKRVREAEKEWVPYIIVVGDEELEKGVYKVRVRDGDTVKLDLEGIIKMVLDEVSEMPKLPLYYPIKVSDRPEIV